MSSELRLRIVSALVLAAVVLLATWYGGLIFKIVAAIIGLLIHYEWTTITRARQEDRAGFAIAWAAQAMIAINIVVGTIDNSVSLIAAFLLVLLARAALRKTGYWLPAGIVYAGLSGVSLAALRGEGHAGLVAMLYLFAIVWGTDIFAYFVGRAVGGRKLAPSISPGKTWSGAIGGAVAGVIAGLALAIAAGVPPSFWLILLSLLLSATSQIGDLFESFIKRRFGVKDSSRLIPGHGGVMDRVDGLVFAAMTAFLTCSAVIWFEGGTLKEFAAILLGI